jgi:hypothetical protein
MASPQQGQTVLSGSMTCSIRGRCAGSEPRLARRFFVRSRLSSSSFFSSSASGGGLQLFQRQIELVFAQPLGFAPEVRTPQLGDEVMKLLVGGGEFVTLQHNCVALNRQPVAFLNKKPLPGAFRQDHGAQGVGIAGEHFG